MPNTHDDNFSTVHVPPPISDFMTETVGGIDMNQCVCKGDFYLDGVLTNTYTPSPSLFFNGSTVNVSGQLVCNDSVVFLNTSQSTGLPFNVSQPQHSVSGTLYTTMVSAALGSGMVKVLCMT
jgi:hypothetical protein